MSDIKLNDPLPFDEIEFRVQSINKGGYATILAYKNARVDMQRLDDAVGAEYWQRAHEFKNNKLYCSVGVYNKAIKQWVWKEDVGTESNAEAEKGQSSDSFKRACSNWGIGRELYNYPLIQIKLKPDEFTVEGTRGKQTWNLKLKEWRWFTQFTENKMNYIGCKDNKGIMRFSWGEYINKEKLKEDLEEYTEEIISTIKEPGQ